jgi:hypothetical protein
LIEKQFPAPFPEVHVMATFVKSAPFVRSFSFPDSGTRVNGGCAVVVDQGQRLGGSIANQDDSDDLDWGDAQTAAFLAGEPLTLGWVSQSPARAGNERAYVYCWVTIDND